MAGMSDRIPITTKGFEQIKTELHRLITVDRPGIQKAIAEAREHGDLKENAEYHAAKERQSFIEGRIQEINGKMPLFQVVDLATLSSNGNKIVFGAKVTLENLDTEEKMQYQIVGPDEANIKLNLISFQSPIAKALIGRQLGDVINVSVPKGNVEVEITDILYE